MSLDGKRLSSGTDTVSMGSKNEAMSFIKDAINIKFDPLESINGIEPVILKKHTISISVTTDQFKILAYVRDLSTEKISVSAMQEFESVGCSQKSEISFSKEEVGPGDALSIQLSGPPNGLCGYSIVDKSVDLVINSNKVTSISYLIVVSQ